MFLALLLACGKDEPTPKAAEVSSEPSSVAAALASLQEGKPPDVKPVNKEPPAVPDAVSERVPSESAPKEGRSGSPECEAARQKRADAEGGIKSFREKDLIEAEQRWLNSQDAMVWCQGDIGGCAGDGKKFQEYLQAEQGALRAFEGAQEKVSTLEANLFPMDQEIEAACGSSR